MVDHRIVVLVTLMTGVVVLLLVRPALNHLSEPTDPDGKMPYAELATPAFVSACVAFAMVGQAIALLALPTYVQPAWVVLATCGVFLAMVDARTTWLPSSVTYLGWSLMLVGTSLSMVLGGDLAGLLRAVIGGAIAWAVYFTLWAATRGGFGFGDVRFAPLLGAATASSSWTLLLWGLTLGSVVGAGHGVLRLLRGRRDPFPYAPSMLTGSYLAAVAVSAWGGP